MNVYDFDGTIYDGDSTVDFWKFCIKRHPVVIFALFPAMFGLGLFLFGIISKTKFKQRAYSFLKHIPNIDCELFIFWESHEKKIKSWYMAQKKVDDIIISASPEFLLKPVCSKLGVSVIASTVDKNTGVYKGENCYGDDKVRRFRLAFPNAIVESFYSDSQSDNPMARVAFSAYRVNGNSITLWSEYKISAANKIHDVFFTPQFFLFLFQGAVCTLLCIIISLILSRYIDPAIAYIGGYSAAILLGYVLNSFIVFKMPLTVVRLVKFLISYIPNFLILFAIVAVSLNVFDLPPIISYTIAPVIGLPLTFVLLKFFAFHKNIVK